MKNDRPSVHNNLGLSYFEKGEFEEALTHYTKAINHDKKSAVHYNNRGLANYHINKLDDAKKDFDQAIELDPNDPTIIFNRGNVYLNWDTDGMGGGKQYEKAIADYDHAISIAPNNAKLWHAKGLAYESKAEDIYNKTGIQNPELNALAIEMYEQALKLQENFISSRFHLGLMYHKTN